MLKLLVLFGTATATWVPPLVSSPEVDEVVPLYAPEDAWRLAHEPESRMVDETTCERVEGAFWTDRQGRRVVIAHARSALFRLDKPRTPFMRVEAREDGVAVARFPARPNEVIVARGYTIDPRTKRYIYGTPYYSVCKANQVVVGDVAPAAEADASSASPVKGAP